MEIEGTVKQYYNNNRYIYLTGTLDHNLIDNPFDFLGNYKVNFGKYSGEVYINRMSGDEISGKIVRDIKNNYIGDLNSAEVEFINLLPLGKQPIVKGNKRYLGKAKLIYGDWLIELNKQVNYKETEEKLKQHGGYANTHNGIIRKIDNEYFEVNELESILSKLVDFLNFINGRRIGTGMIEGFIEGNLVYKRYDNKNITSWNNTRNWYPTSSYEDYLDIFGAFINLFEKELWNERKNYIIGTYFDCFSEQTIEVKIIMIQTFLELIAYIYLVQSDLLPKKERRSPTKFKKSSSKQNIEELFKKLDIPLQETSDYLARNKVETSYSNENQDSIRFLISMRNQIIHPRKSSLFNNKNLRIAYYIGIWMVDMVMLKILGYNGRYWNRLSENKWVGDVENGGSYYWVPWRNNEKILKEISVDE